MCVCVCGVCVCGCVKGDRVSVQGCGASVGVCVCWVCLLVSVCLSVCLQSVKLGGPAHLQYNKGTFSREPTRDKIA